MRRVVLWEGSEDCQACPAQALTLWPSPPARISLRKNTVATVQLEMQTSGDSDRCVYKFVSDTWTPPQHPSWDCQPEREIMRRSFQTRQSGLFPREQDILFLRVDVYPTTSNPFNAPQGLTLLSQQYVVDWIP